MLGWKLVRDRKIKAEPVDLFDAESGLATEREITFMWLQDLNERVAELEDAAGFAPRMRQLALWDESRDGT
jgi:hypothetical protein